MSQSIIRVARRDRDFTITPNALIRDRALSFKARGLLQHMLSLPDDWTFYVSELATQSDRDGIHAVRSGLKELEQAGYLVRTQTRDDRGRIGYETVVYDSPQGSSKPAAPAHGPAPEPAAPTPAPAPAEETPAAPTSDALLGAADELCEAHLADQPDAPSRAFRQALADAEALAADYGTTAKASGNVRNRVLARAFEHVHGELPGRSYPALYKAAKSLGAGGHAWLINAAFTIAHKDLEGADLVAYAVGTANRLKAERAS